MKHDVKEFVLLSTFINISVSYLKVTNWIDTLAENSNDEGSNLYIVLRKKGDVKITFWSENLNKNLQENGY